MIRGTVTDENEPVIELRLRGPHSDEVVLTTLIDTGFTSYLSLPESVVSALDLTWVSQGRLYLADGAFDVYDIYEAEIGWDGSWYTTSVYSMGAEAMIGTSLLFGHRLTVDVINDGPVEITRLP